MAEGDTTPGVQWISCSSGSISGPNPVRGGYDKGGAPLYVGRAFFDNGILPAKVSPANQCAYVSHGGKEHRLPNYQVLNTSNCHVTWEIAFNGEVPHCALKSGKTSYQEPLYTCRVSHQGTLTLGKVHSSQKTAYIPYHGGEVRCGQYEVLVIK